jgi:hypothetical protein
MLFIFLPEDFSTDRLHCSYTDSRRRACLVFAPRINQFTGSFVFPLYRRDPGQPMPIFTTAAVPYRVSRSVPLLHFRILRYAAHHF